MHKLITGLPKNFVVRNLSKSTPKAWHLAVFKEDASYRVNWWDPYYYLEFIQAPEQYSWYRYRHSSCLNTDSDNKWYVRLINPEKDINIYASKLENPTNPEGNYELDIAVKGISDYDIENIPLNEL